jgi:arginase family enzyme
MLDTLTYVWNPTTRVNDDGHLFIGSDVEPVKVGIELANLYISYHNTKFHIEDLIARGLSENVVSFLVNHHIIIPDNLQISCQAPFLYKILSNNAGQISDLIFDRNTENFIVGLPYANDYTHYANDYRQEHTPILSQSLGPNHVYKITSDFQFQRTKFLGNIAYNIFFDDYTKLIERIFYLVYLAIYYKKRIIFIGGEHTLTYFITIAHSKALQNKIKIIHLDAHHDMNSSENLKKQPNHAKPNHANFISFLIDEEWINGLIQVGMRDRTKPGFSSSSTKMEVTETNSLIDENLFKDSGLRRSCNQLSIDIDILDPKLVSNVVAPLPEGWALDDLLKEIKFIFREIPIHVVDICEICNGYYDSSDSAAATGRILEEIDQSSRD